MMHFTLLGYTVSKASAAILLFPVKATWALYQALLEPRPLYDIFHLYSSSFQTMVAFLLACHQ